MPESNWLLIFKVIKQQFGYFQKFFDIGLLFGYFQKFFDIGQLFDYFLEFAVIKK
jgi:hypothetical protein